MPTTETRAGGSIALMLLSVILFAVNTLMVRGLALQVGAIDGWTASLFRGAVGLGFVALVFGFGRGLEFTRVFSRPLLVVRGLLGALGILCFYVTVVHLGAARAVVINLSYPMFATLIAAAVLGESPGARGFGWMAAGFGGLVVFLGGDLDGGVSGYDLLGVAGALVAGCVVVLIRHLRSREHSATIYASQCVASVLVAGPVAGASSLALPATPLLLLALASVVVAIAQLAMTHAYRELSVSRGSAIQMLLPVATGVGGFILFGESFTGIELAGAALTLAATWQVVRRPAAAPVVPRLAGPGT